MHLHNPNHYFHLKSELHELYFSISIRTFAMMLINIFVPIYLLSEGLSLQSTLLFFTVITITHSLMVFPAAKISSKIGLKHLMIWSIPFLITYYLLLDSILIIEGMGIPIYFIAVFGGISRAFYWIGHHTDFAEVVETGKSGKQVGIVKILIGIATAIGPVIGAFLLTWFGFNVVFIIVSFLLFFSVIPLMVSDDKHESFYFSFKNFREIFKAGDIIGHIGFGIEAAAHLVMWPIFIFFFILNQGITALGTISSLSLLFSLLMTYVIANNIDKKTNLFNDLGAVITSGIWLIKNFVTVSFQIVVVDSISGLTSAAKYISFDKIGYDRAKKRKILQYITLREFFINFSTGAMFFIFSFINVNIVFTISFAVAAFGSMLFLFFRDTNKDQ